MKKLLLLMLFALVQLGYAQREANVWHFGAISGLDKSLEYLQYFVNGNHTLIKRLFEK